MSWSPRGLGTGCSRIGSRTGQHVGELKADLGMCAEFSIWRAVTRCQGCFRQRSSTIWQEMAALAVDEALHRYESARDIRLSTRNSQILCVEAGGV